MHPTRIFKTPEDLWKAFEGYKLENEKEAEKWLKVQYVGKEGERVTDATKVPLTIEGFEVYCYNNHGCVNQYLDNKDGLYQDFVTIVTRIRVEIKHNQLNGAFIGHFKEGLTARYNNMREQTDITTQGEKLNHQTIDFGKIPTDLLIQLKDSLRDE